MSKRELSSTLKNLKFMQRANQKEEKSKKEEEVKPEDNFFSPNTVKRKCVVIMEGDPHPGATKGRMSFQNFNPAIDKLNDAANPCQPAVSATCSNNQSEKNCRENRSSLDGEESMNVDKPNCDSNGDLKRKQPEEVSESRRPSKSPKDDQGARKSSPNNSRGSHKQSKHEKLDWNVLRPPKSQNKRA
ncbi:uncharacterized protein LOC117915742 isoform X1 [Vitis riparia]|uniref:uncharacterized protein LOC117915742 isoform X1 n=1 Tax=Vitis riparia TaxID=96939 RepID=UPI00155A536A|nr:uncharacterized protein LOC117915742 isoform X1 [Vitis riparia]